MTLDAPNVLWRGYNILLVFRVVFESVLKFEN